MDVLCMQVVNHGCIVHAGCEPSVLCMQVVNHGCIVHAGCHSLAAVSRSSICIQETASSVDTCLSFISNNMFVIAALQIYNVAVI